MPEPFDCSRSKHDKKHCNEEPRDERGLPDQIWGQSGKDCYVLEELCNGHEAA